MAAAECEQAIGEALAVLSSEEEENQMATSISPHDALAIQPVIRALHAAAAKVHDVVAARQLQDWADRIACQLAAALEEE
jgi:hypothetical protein